MAKVQVSVNATCDELTRIATRGDTTVMLVDHRKHPQANLILLSRRDANADRVLRTLTRHGFYLYKDADGISSFVRHAEVPKLWHRVVQGELSSTEHGVVYSYTPPLLETDTPKLLVVFSSIHEEMYSSSLMRYFTRNYATIQKYVPAETGILRIADLGGVTGAFYLDTAARPRNAAHVQQLIQDVARDHHVDGDSIVLYGASKGATGALYHAISLNVRCVAVDPVVSDEYYERRYRDSHYTAGGIFPRTKQEVFRDLVAGRGTEGAGKWAVVCSERSPQFAYIEPMLVRPLRDTAAFFNSLHPDIHDHPDVGPNTLALTTMLLNNQLYGMPIPPGIRTFR
jgi:hypothetical protein